MGLTKPNIPFWVPNVGPGDTASIKDYRPRNTNHHRSKNAWERREMETGGNNDAKRHGKEAEIWNNKTQD